MRTPAVADAGRAERELFKMLKAMIPIVLTGCRLPGFFQRKPALFDKASALHTEIVARQRLLATMTVE